MNNQLKLFRKVNEIVLFDDNMIESAKECFQDYVEKGIILTTNFEENKWETTNEYSNVSFIFNLNKFQYKRFYEQVFQLSFDDFVTTFFVAGPGSSTLPLRIYSMIRLGVSPVINALSVLLIGISIILTLSTKSLQKYLIK